MPGKDPIVACYTDSALYNAEAELIDEETWGKSDTALEGFGKQKCFHSEVPLCVLCRSMKAARKKQLYLL